ncbi:MAG: 50S ribosomal protein L11 methyltransferase [Alphaproteobacteria bacterium]|nr:50S ribosomal protein L11 methyltransferase [Alphaproteobacteria bacterium]
MSPSYSHRVNLAIGEEMRARSIADVLGEVFFEECAVAAFERDDGRWDIAIHCATAPDPDLTRQLVATVAGTEVADKISFDQVEARDWVKASLEELAPVSAGRFVVHGAHDRARIPANKLGIEIEAALAFGSGHHATTFGCLCLLDHVLKQRRPQVVLDLGTGSGVLAIAAAKALHHPVLASDIDPLAARVAAANTRLNHVQRHVRVIQATGLAAPEFANTGPFNLVLANILANPLRSLAQPMSRHLAPRADVILSGLLTTQAAAVIAAYRLRGLVPARHLSINGWSSLLLHTV